MKRVLILGAGGMLGRSWSELLRERGVAHDALARERFSLAEPGCGSRLAELAARTPEPWDLIVNCGAYTQVDLAESQYEQAHQVNALAVGELAEFARLRGARLVHYSTDYVFDGQAAAPYPVDAPIAPINAYGRSKAEGERLLLESGAAFLLIRTSWVYAPWGKNFVLTMARLLRDKPELRVVSDQRGRPSSAEQLAERSYRLCQRAPSGTFHLTDAGECSWYEFAVAIRDQLGLTTPIHPIPTKEYPTPAVRPPYSVLDTSAADTLIGPARQWPAALAPVLQRAQ